MREMNIIALLLGVGREVEEAVGLQPHLEEAHVEDGHDGVPRAQVRGVGGALHVHALAHRGLCSQTNTQNNITNNYLF